MAGEVAQDRRLRTPPATNFRTCPASERVRSTTVYRTLGDVTSDDGKPSRQQEAGNSYFAVPTAASGHAALVTSRPAA